MAARGDRRGDTDSGRSPSGRCRRVVGAAMVCAALVVSSCSADGDQGADRPSGGVAADVDGGSGIEMSTIEIEPSVERSDRSAAEAAELLDAVRAAADEQGWTEPGGPAAAGYVPMPFDPSHWHHPGHVVDEQIFDPSRPEFLVVENDAAVGAMFLARDARLDQPDPPGAPQVRWHYHRWSEPICLEHGLVVTGPASGGSCAGSEVVATESPLMAHVWLVDIDDPFATEMGAHHH